MAFDWGLGRASALPVCSQPAQFGGGFGKAKALEKGTLASRNAQSEAGIRSAHFLVVSCEFLQRGAAGDTVRCLVGHDIFEMMRRCVPVRWYGIFPSSSRRTREGRDILSYSAASLVVNSA